jgi:septum formation protein
MGIQQKSGQPPPLVLASGSPRRSALLVEAGIPFTVEVPAVEESATRALTLRELTGYNAARKAIAVARRHPDAVVLGADTLVALDGEAIGKPRDLREAAQILRRLSGREHQVHSGVALVAARTIRTFHVVSHVRFRSLTDGQIVAYLAKIDPLDKAGAYAAQGHGAEIIQRLRGSYSNVVGLPMEETVPALAEFGITPRTRRG